MELNMFSSFDAFVLHSPIQNLEEVLHLEENVNALEHALKYQSVLPLWYHNTK